LVVKEPIQAGDRLRLHQEATGERIAFTLRTLTKNGRKAAQANRGESVILEVPARVKTGDSLFKVDSRAAREAEKEKPVLVPEEFDRTVRKLQRKVEQKIGAIHKNLVSGAGRKKRTGSSPRKKAGKAQEPSPPCMLKSMICSC